MTLEKRLQKRVLLGAISGVHGIRGDVIVRSYTADPGDIAAYGALETDEGTQLPPLHIVRVTDRGVIARLEGISDRTRAETYKGTQLWIARAKLPTAAAGEYYHADLIGLHAVSPEGATIGEVIAVENFGAGDLLEIRLQGSNQTEFVPFTNAVVPHVDLASGTMTVVIPDSGDDEDDAGIKE